MTQKKVDSSKQGGSAKYQSDEMAKNVRNYIEEVPSAWRADVYKSAICQRYFVHFIVGINPIST